MGLTSVQIEIGHSSGAQPEQRGDFLVDSGATLTVLPEGVWKSLAIEPEAEVTVSMADGRLAHRKVGAARIRFQGRQALCQVILGEADDSPLVGVLTLEQLGLALDPLKRSLHAMPIRM